MNIHADILDFYKICKNNINKKYFFKNGMTLYLHSMLHQIDGKNTLIYIT